MLRGRTLCLLWPQASRPPFCTPFCTAMEHTVVMPEDFSSLNFRNPTSFADQAWSQYSLDVLFPIRAPDSKNHAVYPALNTTQVCETHLHKARCVPPNCPGPSVRSGVGYLSASISQSTVMGNGAPQPYCKKYGKVCEAINSKLFQGFSHPQPYAQYHRYALLPVSLWEYFWQSPSCSCFLH